MKKELSDNIQHLLINGEYDINQNMMPSSLKSLKIQDPLYFNMQQMNIQFNMTLPNTLHSLKFSDAYNFPID
jgi:hypothetical protein